MQVNLVKLMSQTTVEQITAKVRELVDVLERTRQQRDVLLQENARLTEAVDAVTKQKEQLLSANEALEGKLTKVQTLPVSDPATDSKRMEIKGKIRELAAEIDKCLALLNQEK